MRLAICDDDPLIVEKIQKYIQSYFTHINQKTPEIVCYHNGEALLDDKLAKDIIFLDIEMSGIDGISVGRELKKQNKDIIIFIITSFVEYLDDAMSFHVFRYLSKPIDRQRFFRNMKDAINLYHTLTVTIPIETRQGVHTVSASSIIFIEAEGRKVFVHTTKNDYESIHKIQYWLEILPKNNFFLTHRSFIVNFEHITDFDHFLIYFSDKRFKAYLSKRKYSEFKRAYLLYMESTR